jgi:hypothetical protein
MVRLAGRIIPHRPGNHVCPLERRQALLQPRRHRYAIRINEGEVAAAGDGCATVSRCKLGLWIATCNAKPSRLPPRCPQRARQSSRRQRSRPRSPPFGLSAPGGRESRCEGSAFQVARRAGVEAKREQPDSYGHVGADDFARAVVGRWGAWSDPHGIRDENS